MLIRCPPACVHWPIRAPRSPCAVAIDQYRNLGDWYNTAGTLGHLGDLHSGEGNENAARRSWIQARTILEKLKHSDLKKIKKKLNKYTQSELE